MSGPPYRRRLVVRRRPGDGLPPQRNSDGGQAAVELALVLPLVAIVILIVLQIVSVVRDSVAIVAAARAGARQAMVDPSTGAVRSAVVGETRLEPARVAVSVGGDTSPGGRVTVTVSYRSPTDLPVVGRFVGDVVLRERFTVLRE